jgi:hypothetical protein
MMDMVHQPLRYLAGHSLNVALAVSAALGVVAGIADGMVTWFAGLFVLVSCVAIGAGAWAMGWVPTTAFAILAGLAITAYCAARLTIWFN